LFFKQFIGGFITLLKSANPATCMIYVIQTKKPRFYSSAQTLT